MSATFLQYIYIPVRGHKDGCCCSHRTHYPPATMTELSIMIGIWLVILGWFIWCRLKDKEAGSAFSGTFLLFATFMVMVLLSSMIAGNN